MRKRIITIAVLISLSYVAGVLSPLALLSVAHENYARAASAGIVFTPGEIKCTRNVDYHYCAEVNSRGFRGKEPVQDNRCRVAFAGSSFVYGLGVYDEQTWVALLESDTVQPFNLGALGATLYDALDFARLGYNALHYDVLVLGVTPGETADDMKLPRMDVRDTDAVTARFKDAQQIGVPVGVIALPYLSRNTAQHPTVEAAAKRAGLPYLSFALPATDYYPVYDHYTVQGNIDVAKQVTPFIEQLCKEKP